MECSGALNDFFSMCCFDQIDTPSCNGQEGSGPAGLPKGVEEV
jgi:hypothetical protein